MKNRLLTTTLFALAGLGVLAAETKTDYNKATDFGAYKTYSWLKVDGSTSLWSDRIKRDVDQELAAKGWTLRQGDGADVAIAAMGTTKTRQSYTTFYDGLGGGWYWRGFNDTVATTTVQDTEVGTLTVDIFDGKTKKLVWRGMATKTLSEKPEKNEKKLEDAVNDLFKKFPPKGDS